jgi:site-specific DNA recombinase
MNGRAVGYSRVSTSGQLSNNSLLTQEEKIMSYAAGNSLEVVRFFGNTNESGLMVKDRDEFHAMLDYIYDKRNKIKYILVANWSRFSRDGLGSVAQLLTNLFKQGVEVIAVNMAKGLFPVYDKYRNDLEVLKVGMQTIEMRNRRKDGQIRHLKSGLSLTKPPLGYQHTSTNGLYAPGKEAHLIAEAFTLKAKGLRSPEILDRLSNLGLSLNKEQLNRILANRYYCGYISHAYLEGELVKGMHTPIIPEALFYEANSMQRVQKRKTNIKTASFPLEGILLHCNRHVTSYTNHSKAKRYYKCNSCRTNINADAADKEFISLLSTFNLNAETELSIRNQLATTFEEMGRTEGEQIALLQKELARLEKQANKREEEYDIGEINRERFEKAIKTITTHKNTIEQKLAALNQKRLSVNAFLEFAMSIIKDPINAWLKADQKGKEVISSILFPQGVTYISKYRRFEVPEVCGVFKQVQDANNYKLCLPCKPLQIVKVTLSKYTYCKSSA